MSTPCPFCREARSDAAGLAIHLEAQHAHLMAQVIAAGLPPAIPVVEIDIDRIHTSAIVAEKAAKAVA